MTVLDIITRSLQDLNIVPGGGDVPDPNDAQLALDRLNDWIDGLALEGLTIPTIARVTWNLGNGTASYDVGSGSTVNVSKPVSPQAISNIGYYSSTLSPVTEILFGAVLTDAQYQYIPQKTMQATAPTGFYYEPTNGTNGTIGKLYPLPIPNISTLVGVIYAPSQLTEVALTTTIELPKGYRRFFRSNLTLELAAAFEKQVPAGLRAIANDSKMRVKAANARTVDMGFDSAVPSLRGSLYNIYTDQ